ncbi:hypothetical protein FQN54_000596 [Arachnomyces sp. PD_36]|nr:hypothetical protein FQN54_000596 [Arachnomyces sp. PD_36]
MPLHVTPSRVRKPAKNSNPPKRASPFATHSRQKPVSRPRISESSRAKLGQEIEDNLSTSHIGHNGGAYGSGESLPDTGPSTFIPDTAPVEGDVIRAIRYIKLNMFCELPARIGMNSVRIAELLNFRRSLPPIASTAHIHTLINAPTKVEKEIVQLIKSGQLRRLTLIGRGNNAASLGDYLVIAEDWKQMIRDSSALDDGLKERFLQVLERNPQTSVLASGLLSSEDSSLLLHAGFLISNQGVRSLGSASGAAAGRHTGEDTRERFRPSTMALSLPNTGPYIRLLDAGRSHLMTLLKKSDSQEIPVYLLKDRWDGAVETNTSSFAAKRARGESSGVLPGKTKKWKDLYGMNFRWALEEALGAGLIELFETGSVGPGVRCL